jgi:hypothetical protein
MIHFLSRSSKLYILKKDRNIWVSFNKDLKMNCYSRVLTNDIYNLVKNKTALNFIEPMPQLTNPEHQFKWVMA